MLWDIIKMKPTTNTNGGKNKLELTTPWDIIKMKPITNTNSGKIS